MMNLKQARIKAGYTQIQLAEMVSISQTALSQIETGLAFPRKGTRAKIEEVLGKKIDWLETRLGSMSTQSFGRGGDSAEDNVISAIYVYVKSGPRAERPLKFALLRRFVSKFEKKLNKEQQEIDEKIRRR